ANWENRSSISIDIPARCFSGSKSGTSAAICTLNRLGSLRLTRREPLRAAINPSQNAPRPTPIEETTPIPVMATRRISRSGRRRALGEYLAQRLDYLANTLHLLDDLIRNADIELVFECEHEIDAVERIDPHLLKCRLGGDCRGLELLFLRDEPDNFAFKLRTGGIYRRCIARLWGFGHRGGSPWREFLYGIPSSGWVKESVIFLPSMDLLDKLRAIATRLEPHAHDRFRPFLTTIDSLINPGEVIIQGRRTLMFGSNNYLGLTSHPEVIAAAKHALDLYGSGTTGSRIANGTLGEHEALEHDFARFFGKRAASIFTTGYQANLGMIGALCGPGDVVMLDAESHASICDATRLSGAEVVWVQ